MVAYDDDVVAAILTLGVLRQGEAPSPAALVSRFAELREALRCWRDLEAVCETERWDRQHGVDSRLAAP